MKSQLFSFRFLLSLFIVSVPSFSFDDSNKDFEATIRPLLKKYCFACHDPQDEHSESDFLRTQKLSEIESMRSEWKKVISQLRNRAMPPADEDLQPTEKERMELATWLESRLPESALRQPEYAGFVETRRLNRDMYNQTIRDLIGLDLGFDNRFPAEGSGGEGFDNNGETLFLQPLLMERMLEAAQEILDKAIISPPYSLSFESKQQGQTKPSDIETLARIAPTIFKNSRYKIELDMRNLGDNETSIDLKVDGIKVKRFKLKKSNNVQYLQTKLKLTRGIHQMEVCSAGKNHRIRFQKIKVTSQFPFSSRKDKAIHGRIFCHQPGKTKSSRDQAARKIIDDFAARAFRRPIRTKETESFFQLYSRSIQRGDPFEEAIKLALSGVLVSPHFLFLIEDPPHSNAVEPINDFELASRLSYFLWSSMPDDKLLTLADAKKLQSEVVLKEQTKRLLADERSESFFRLFTGQWLGTREVGSKVGPVGDQKKQGYTSELGFSLRDEPIHFLSHVFKKDRPLTDLIDSDYVLVNQWTSKHYGLEKIDGMDFQKVNVSNNQRGGLLGMGAVHMLTSTSSRTSPVLRGVWVHETLLGTHVPSPPDDVPELNARRARQKKQTIRRALAEHRNHAACATCHNIIDPIGFGLENYDYLGRWRTKDQGIPIDSTATMPDGTKFRGPNELKKILLKRKDQFVRHLTAKMLGYALGRSLVDRDAGTIEKIVEHVRKNNYSSLSLLIATVTSIPFRNRQQLSSGQTDQ